MFKLMVNMATKGISRIIQEYELRDGIKKKPPKAIDESI